MQNFINLDQKRDFFYLINPKKWSQSVWIVFFIAMHFFKKKVDEKNSLIFVSLTGMSSCMDAANWWKAGSSVH